MRFVGLALHEPVPDAKTIWLYREQLVGAGRFERLFAQFDRVLRERGYLTMDGQNVDATIVEARRPRLNDGEKETIEVGGTPAEWKPARRAQIGRDGPVDAEARQKARHASRGRSEAGRRARS